MTTNAPERGSDRLLDHEYDGIREYDNPLPDWWVWVFVATIVFSGGYWAWYQIGPGTTILAQYDAEVREAHERAERHPVAAAGADEETLRRLQHDTAAMASAQALFASRCAACHGPQGQGIIGPNLTDEFWLHGGTLTAIRHTIAEGVVEKGMVAWKDQLKPAELDAVAAYIGRLSGSHPPNPKPPQGTRASADSPSVALRR